MVGIDNGHIGTDTNDGQIVEDIQITRRRIVIEVPPQAECIGALRHDDDILSLQRIRFLNGGPQRAIARSVGCDPVTGVGVHRIVSGVDAERR